MEFEVEKHMTRHAEQAVKRLTKTGLIKAKNLKESLVSVVRQGR
jgi:hypothetical protein